jgi:hypothetical protein
VLRIDAAYDRGKIASLSLEEVMEQPNIDASEIDGHENAAIIEA